MKKAIYLIMLTIMCILVFADSTFVRETLEEGEENTYELEEGFYTLKVEIITSENEVKFRLNGEISETLTEGESNVFKDKSEVVVKEILVSEETTDEVSFYFYGSGNAPMQEIDEKELNINTCNFNNLCEENENREYCCSDCSCGEGEKCTDNICIEKDICGNNIECDDNDPCTTDICEKEECTYTGTQGCPANNRCLSIGSPYTLNNIPSYCQGDWLPKKEKEAYCTYDYECLNNSCKKNKCKKSSLTGGIIIIILLVSLIIIFHLFKKTKKNKIFGRKYFK